MKDPAPWDRSKSLGEAFLEPTAIYVDAVKHIQQKTKIKGMVHITGGGFPENLPRMLPKGLACRIESTSWKVPPMFEWIQKVNKASSERAILKFS